MVNPFQFARIPNIHFKNGISGDLPRFIRPYGNKILVVTGKNSFIRSSYAKNIFQNMDQSGIVYHMVYIPGEPSPAIIDNVVNSYFRQKIDLVVGIGGGSVLDAGKAISAMMYKSDPVIEFLEGIGHKEHNGTKLPFIAVPTTSGTGSEATKNAVISQVGKDGFKRSLRHDNFVPDIALIDPVLTLGCSQDLTAASGMDCFTQLTEAYLSTKSNEFTDALAMEGLKKVKNSLLRCYINGDDLEARTGMSFAALTSGICLANAGLGAVHGFASSIGGLFNIPHGLVCGTLMAISNEVNVRELRKSNSNPSALKKYIILGKLFLDESGKTDEFYIDGFINYLHKLTTDLQLPGLRKYGVSEKDAALICSKTEIKNNPVKLTTEVLIEILQKRL